MNPFSSRALALTLCVTTLATWTAPAFAQPVVGHGAGQQGKRVSVQSKTDKDLRLLTFRTDHGNIGLVLPAEVAPGDTISGTMMLSPAGGSSGERDKNQEQLSRYRIELASLPPTRRDAGSDKAVWTFPADASAAGKSISVALRDGAGQEVAQTTIPILANSVSPQPSTTPERAFVMPSNGKQGEPLSIRGRFDGDAATTKVGLGGQAANILAESPRVCVVQTPKQALGKTQITLQEGGNRSSLDSSLDATSAASGTLQQDFDHQKPRRRSNVGWIIGGVLLVGLIAIAIAFATTPLNISPY